MREGAVIDYKPILIFNSFGICIGKTSMKWTTKGAKVFRRGLENGEAQDAA